MLQFFLNLQSIKKLEFSFSKFSHSVLMTDFKWPKMWICKTILSKFGQWKSLSRSLSSSSVAVVVMASTFNLILLPGVPGIVAFIDVCPWRYQTANFWASPKSQVATTYLCMHFCSNYIGWSNQVKYYEIEIHCDKQNVATWLYDEANIFQFDIFVWKHRPTG